MYAPPALCLSSCSPLPSRIPHIASDMVRSALFLFVRMAVVLLAVVALAAFPAISAPAGNIRMAGHEYCISTPDASMVAGTQLKLASCISTATSQLFTFSSSDGSVCPQAAPAMCIQGASEYGTFLTLQSCNGGANQSFDFLLNGFMVLSSNPNFQVITDATHIEAGVNLQMWLIVTDLTINQHWQAPWTTEFRQTHAHTRTDAQRTASDARAHCCSC